MSDTFSVGDVCWLRSGGPKMTVVKESFGGSEEGHGQMANVVFFTEDGNRLNRDRFPCSALVKLQAEKADKPQPPEVTPSDDITF